jgi:ribonuclease-3
MTIPDVPIKDEALLSAALRHRSAVDGNIEQSYERLEFFGDSILGMIIAEYLYEHFPSWDQGKLSKAKATVVQEAPLAETALKLGLENYIELSTSEAAAGGATRASILADVFEALIGALYIEQGFSMTRWFVLEHLHPYLQQVAMGDIGTRDYKSRLQEVAQARWRKTPTYRLTGERGESHERAFEMEILLDGEVMGKGFGKSKKEAEQEAARDALEMIARYDSQRGHKTQDKV